MQSRYSNKYFNLRRKIYKIQIIKANMSSPEEFLGAMATFQKPRQNICLIFQHQEYREIPTPKKELL